MSALDYINQQGNAGSSVTDIIAAHKKAGTLKDTVKFYPARTPSVAPTPEPVQQPGFLSESIDTIKAVAHGDVKFSDFLHAVPKNAVETGKAISDYVAPAITKFAKTTGSIFGEGLAYATDKNVREQYKQGHLEILPTITEMTPPRLAKYTIAAGLEASIFKFIPDVAKMNLAGRGGVGALQGIGMAITNGMANDKSPEDIIKDMPKYGVPGAVLNIVFPYLAPLLSKEVKIFPSELKSLIQEVDKSVTPSVARKVSVGSAFPDKTAVPISTPNSRYEAYLRSQGYEPYVHDAKLPTIEAGTVPKPVEKLPSIDVGAAPPLNPTVDLPPPVGTKLVPEKVPTTSAPEKTPVVSQETTSPVKQAPQETFQGHTYNTGDILPAETKVTKVPSAQLPLGEGKTKVSTLEQRMRKTYDNINESTLSSDSAATYQQMSKKDQIARDAAFVDTNHEDAMAILRGEKNLPEGISKSGLTIALANKVEKPADAALAVRLGSLNATRQGQEISLLSEAQPDSVVSNITDIIKARSQRAARKTSTGIASPNEKQVKASVSKEVTKTVKEGKKKLELSQLKISEAEKLLNDILC
jgi:hypothetical protein